MLHIHSAVATEQTILRTINKGVALNDMIWRPSTSKWDKAVYSEPTLLPRKAKKSRYNLKKSSVSSNHGAAEVMRTTGTTITQKKGASEKLFYG